MTPFGSSLGVKEMRRWYGDHLKWHLMLSLMVLMGYCSLRNNGAYTVDGCIIMGTEKFEKMKRYNILRKQGMTSKAIGEAVCAKQSNVNTMKFPHKG